MTCRHCENGMKDLSGNKITNNVESEGVTVCTVTEDPCLCECHVAIEGAKEYNDI